MLGGFLVVIWFISPIMWGVSISTSSVFRLLFIPHFSQERVVFAVHAHVGGHFV
jgi:hypothetical protein